MLHLSTQSMSSPQRVPPVGSAWVMANAGSGKTYTLTWRVVGLLLRGVAAESIWCVTYTNAAAAEMEERLLATLKKMHEADNAALLALLAEPLPECAQPELLPVARALYHSMLHGTHGGVRYTTMHGLCQSLLQTFPLEAGISEGAVLLDTQEGAKMRRDAIRHVLGMQLDSNSALAQARQHLVSVANFGHAIELIEKSMAKTAMMETGFVQEAETLLDDRNALLGLPSKHNAAAEKQAFIDNAPIATPDAIVALVQSSNKNDQARGDLLQAWRDADTPTRATLYDTYIDVFLTKTMGLRASLGTKKAVPPDSVAAQTLAREQDRVHRHIQTLAALALAEDSAAMQAIAQAANDAYQSQKVAQEVLDYDDLLRVAHRLLTSPNMMPWVMHKLDYRLEHLLVDEAQDTSPIQWKMIAAFCEEIIAQSDAAQQPKTLFVVGDEKQSIYSFNGAAPHWLGKMQASLSAMLPDGIQPQTLATSYRSSQAVLDWVNVLCANESVAPSMANHAIAPHSLHHQNLYGRVECWPLAEAVESEGLPPYTMPQAPLQAQTAHAALAETIAEQLQTRVLGMALRGKPVQPGDVIILVRTRSALVGNMNAALMKRGIPVAGLDRLRLTEHPAVRDAMALMAWCLQPADDMALAQVMMSPLLGMSPTQLEEIAYGRGEASLWQALQTQSPPCAAQLLHWKHDAEKGSYAMLQAALLRDKRAQAFCQRMGQDALEVLDELLLYLFAKHEEQADALSLTLHDLQRDAPEIKREQHGDGAANAVRIMTVHGAKGLQAPVVILADTTRTPTLQKEQIYQDESHVWSALQPMAGHAQKWDALKEVKKSALTDEYYRLLYVAATRAEDVLIVAGAGNAQSGSWYDVMRKALGELNPLEDDPSGQLRYEAGEAQAIPPEEQKKLDTHAEPPTWLHAPTPAYQGYKPLRPSHMQERAAQANTRAKDGTAYDGDPQAYGNCFHALMEWANATTGDEEITQFAALHQQSGDRLLREFRSLWKSEDISRLLRMPSRCEQDMMARFSMNAQPYEFRGQVDRLIITDTDCIVLDYKTSLAPPDTMPEHYQKQLISYVLMLRKFLPNHAMRAGLLWTAHAKLAWVSESDLSIDEAAFYDVALT